MASANQPQPDFNNLANSFRSLGNHERDMAGFHDTVAEQLALLRNLPGIDNGSQILRELRQFREESRTELRTFREESRTELRTFREETQAANERLSEHLTARMNAMEFNMVARLNNSILAGDGADILSPLRTTNNEEIQSFPTTIEVLNNLNAQRANSLGARLEIDLREMSLEQKRAAIKRHIGVIRLGTLRATV
ncbi:hypothetical protein K440DRAFT_665056 [Wilcoxina mikolae CBS 423.85]|nr:hypothetical protein K440DRAFT_665056 [Wilcoxina mikolae CBS 423.85]